MVEIRYNTGYGFATGGSYYGSDLSSEAEDVFNASKFPNYIYCDGEGIDLTNNSAKFYQSGDYTGYISKPSDENGNISQALNEGLITFWGDFSTVVTAGLTIQFYGDCCRDMTIKYKHLASAGATTTLATYRIADDQPLKITGDKFYHIPVLSSNECNKIEISFNKSKVPHQAVKIASVSLGDANVVSLTEIKSTTLSENINILSDDLPVSEFDFTVVYEKELKIDHKISVYSNSIYYGTFWITNCKKVGVKKEWVLNETTGEQEYKAVKSIYEVTAVNAIGKLDELCGYWESTVIFDVYAIFTTFLETMRDTTGIKTLNPISTYNGQALLGYIPRSSFRYTLCAFGWGLGYVVDANRSDRINLLPMIHGSMKIIPSSRIIGEAKYTKEPVITKAKYSFTDSIGQSEVGGQVTLKATGGKLVTVFFDNPPAVIYIDENADPLSWSSDAYGYVYKTDSDITATKIGRAVRLETVELENHRVPTAAKNVVEYNNFDVVGLNPYYFTQDLIPEITGTKVYRTEDILRIVNYSDKGKINARIVLDGERCGDRVAIMTAFDGNKQGIITKMNISFGYKDVADIEVTICDAQEWQG